MTGNQLRQRAEDAMRMTRRDVSALRDEDTQRVIHELQVHQIELEMQNESLATAQDALEASRELYRELYDSAPVAYLSIDVTGRIVRANSAAATLMGMSQTRLVGKQLAAFVVEDDLAHLRDHLVEAREHAPASCELQLCNTGGCVHVQLNSSQTPGRLDCLTVVTDLAASKRAQSALETLNLELEARVIERTAQLEARGRALEAEMAARTRNEQRQRELSMRLGDSEHMESHGLLAGGVAHDFNNLLVGVLGNADLLLLTPDLPDSWIEPLTGIKHAARNTADLTRQLLIYAGLGCVNMAAVDLSQIIGECLTAMRTRLGSDIELRTELASDLPCIEADRGQIHQLATNLVTNAIEAMDGDGLIIVRTYSAELDAAQLECFPHCAATPGTFVILEVHDTGPGIELIAQPRIFEPFFSTKFGGRGLGLASVAGIVHGHRGALRVMSVEGDGSLFEIALPVGLPMLANHSPQPAAGDAEWRGSGCVLLIDDDEHVRGVFEELLGHLGFQVTAIASGEEGIRLLESAAPGFEFIVLDWMLPGMTGQEVLHRVRELAPELPVVLVSGHDGQTRGIRDQFAVRLQKPTSLAELQAAILAVYRPTDKH